MLNDQCLVGFVATTDLGRAHAFYAETLGLPLLRDEGIARVYRTGANELRVVHVKGFSPQPFTVTGWRVDDVAAMAATLRRQGVELERYPFVESEDGVWTSPGGSRVAWFKDPDGNVLSISDAGREDWYTRPVLFVADVRASVAFYEERLGFEERWAHEEAGEVIVAQVDKEGFELILNRDAQRAGAGRVFVSLREYQRAELRAQLDSRGVVTDARTWGMPITAVTDPDGNEIFFSPPLNRDGD